MALLHDHFLTEQDAGGSLRTKREAHAALQSMVATLGDRYTEFLRPDRFRFALRKPMPAEREYLAAQFTGTGLQVAKRSPYAIPSPQQVQAHWDVWQIDWGKEEWGGGEGGGARARLRQTG